MAEDAVELSEGRPPQELPPLFLEVACRSSGKRRRFAAGTEAGFAVRLMNRRVESGSPSALYIEAVKEGEEPVAFGPNSALVDYGSGWSLQTVTEEDFDDTGGSHGDGMQHMAARFSHPNSAASKAGKDPRKPVISLAYIGKILIAFVLIFVLGAIFTLALEFLPMLILSINSFM